MKLVSLILYKTIFFFDKFIKLTFKKSILNWFKEFLHKDSYKKIKILEKDVTFFIPNRLTEWRVDTFFSKEPETLEWINSMSDFERISILKQVPFVMSKFILFSN